MQTAKPTPLHHKATSTRRAAPGLPSFGSTLRPRLRSIVRRLCTLRMRPIRLKLQATLTLALAIGGSAPWVDARRSTTVSPCLPGSEPLMPSLTPICALTCLAFCANFTPARADQILQSGSHDTLILRIIEAPAIEDTSRPTHARLVTICLRDTPASGQRKAFDIQTATPPRFIVPLGGQQCTLVEPTRHAFYFWKTQGGTPSPVLSYRLDLRRFARASVHFDWVKDQQN